MKTPYSLRLTKGAGSRQLPGDGQWPMESEDSNSKSTAATPYRDVPGE
jgi:hypothetical protein